MAAAISRPWARVHLLLVACLVMALAALAATPSARASVGGPVILGGDDLTDHGSFDTSSDANVGGWLYIQRAFENISPKVQRPNDGSIAALGSADSTTTGGGDAGAAMHYAAQKAGLPVTTTTALQPSSSSSPTSRAARRARGSSGSPATRRRTT